MKTISCLLILHLFFIPTIVKSQNQISNGSFEFGTAGYPTNRHQTKGKTNSTDDIGPDNWKSQYSIDNGYHLHSPDWFNSNSYALPDVVGSGAQDGTYYIGMGDYELLSQQCPTSDGEVYSFCLYFQLSDDISGGNFDSHLQVILSENQPEYKSDDFNDLCESDYKTLDHTGDKQSILDFPLSATTYPVGSGWHKVAFLFRANGDYSWLTLQVENGPSTSSCERSYICIDNVKLEEICSLPCLPPEAHLPINYSSVAANLGMGNSVANAGLQGQTSIYFENPDGSYTWQTPWHVYLQNALGFEFVAWNGWQMGGAVTPNLTFFDALTLTNRNNNYYTFVWGGENVIIQNMLPPDLYNYEMTVWNCYESVTVQNDITFFPFEAVDQDHALINNLYYNLSIPDGCCRGRRYIRNVTYAGAEEVHVNDFIEAGNESFDYYEWCCNTPGPVVVPSGAQVTYFTENSINLLDGFSSESGSNFETKIESCGNMDIRFGKHDRSDVWDDLRDQSIELADEFQSAFIYPNPSYDYAKVIVPNTENWKYILLDSNDKEIMSGEVKGSLLELQLTNIATGLYFVKISASNSFKVVKLNKQNY